MRARYYLVPALLVLAIGYLIYRVWGMLLYAALSYGAYRVWRFVSFGPKRARRRRGTVREWIDALSGVVIAWNTRGISKSKRETIEPGPTPQYRMRSKGQLPPDEPLPF